jgi:hypothetical protein
MRKRRPGKDEYEASVFINCPLDPTYRRLFYPIIFTVFDCGYIPRNALEVSDTSQVRVARIAKIIAECRIGIHDISRTEMDRNTRLPRFNMPLELGMFLGAKQYGDSRQRTKICLVLDRSPHRYQKFCSDIAGQDISAHSRDVRSTIGAVRDFLRNASSKVMIPGEKVIYQRYIRFSRELPRLCRQLGLTKNRLIFNDYATIVERWLKRYAHARR